MRGECPLAHDECKYAGLGGCFADDHHLAYPRKKYRSPLAKKYAKAVGTIHLCRAQHDNIHAVRPNPPIPSAHEMRRAIEASRGC